MYQITIKNKTMKPDLTILRDLIKKEIDNYGNVMFIHIIGDVIEEYSKSFNIDLTCRYENSEKPYCLQIRIGSFDIDETFHFGCNDSGFGCIDSHDGIKRIIELLTILTK